MSRWICEYFKFFWEIVFWTERLIGVNELRVILFHLNDFAISDRKIGFNNKELFFTLRGASLSVTVTLNYPHAVILESDNA